MTLDIIRKYLEQEKADLMNFQSTGDVEEAQHRINNWFYGIGRKSVLEDILKWEQKMSEREFQIAKKKGTL